MEGGCLEIIWRSQVWRSVKMMWHWKQHIELDPLGLLPLSESHRKLQGRNFAICEILNCLYRRSSTYELLDIWRKRNITDVIFRKNHSTYCQLPVFSLTSQHSSSFLSHLCFPAVTHLFQQESDSICCVCAGVQKEGVRTGRCGRRRSRRTPCGLGAFAHNQPDA